ncbi:MAG: UMP kinase [Rhizobiales bacterium]|nr:UMP kinase [Hyphomicrobiales bacterium]
MAELKYKRLLVKLSGEALMGAGSYGIDVPTVERLAEEVHAAVDTGTRISLVIGGGNIFRGLQGAARGMDRGAADYMGMLATVMNALAFQNALSRTGVEARVLSAIPMHTVCEPFTRSRALHHLDNDRVVIFAAGTGNPFFTTDTAGALRAIEMGCDAMAKATSVDGIYSADPKVVPGAQRFERLSYEEVLARNLKVMDGAAIALARDNRLPIIVFSIREPGNLVRLVRGQALCTVVGPADE